MSNILSKQQSLSTIHNSRQYSIVYELIFYYKTYFNLINGLYL